VSGNELSIAISATHNNAVFSNPILRIVSHGYFAVISDVAETMMLTMSFSVIPVDDIMSVKSSCTALSIAVTEFSEQFIAPRSAYMGILYRVNEGFARHF